MAAGALNSVVAPATSLVFEDLAVGQKASLTGTVTNDEVRLFAEVGGDADAVHVCDVLAARTPFGQHIAHGMFTASLVSAVLGTRLPGPGAVYLSQTIQFLAPLRIGDVVTATVEIVELVAARRRVRLFCECTCEGRVVLEGEAWVAVESRAARS